MKTNEPAQSLGDLVAASYDLGRAMGVAPDTKAAGELAARHLERVLVRGSNLRLNASLARLARELGPLKAAPLGAPRVAHAA
jgi:hypothetical protein